MKVLLDENITKKSIQVLEKYGHNVIVFIPPRADLAMHYGLVWLRGFQVTNKSYEAVMDIIGKFLKCNGDTVINAYYAMKKKGDSYEIIRRFPQIPKVVVK